MSVTIGRGEGGVPAPGFSFEVDRPVTVFLAVHDRGAAKLPAGWEKTDGKIRWKAGAGAAHADSIYKRSFTSGKVEVPGHSGQDGSYYGIPNMAIVGDKDAKVKAGQ